MDFSGKMIVCRFAMLLRLMSAINQWHLSHRRAVRCIHRNKEERWHTSQILPVCIAFKSEHQLNLTAFYSNIHLKIARMFNSACVIDFGFLWFAGVSTKSNLYQQRIHSCVWRTEELVTRVWCCAAVTRICVTGICSHYWTHGPLNLLVSAVPHSAHTQPHELRFVI